MKEAWIILIACGIVLVTIVGLSFAMGYETADGRLPTVLGFPKWVFWSVLVPWGCSVVFCVWFSLRGMKDDPLEDEGEPDA